MTNKKKYKYPNGNPGATQNPEVLKRIYGKVIINKNAEIRYLKKQYKGTILRMMKVLTAYHDVSTRDVFKGGDEMKYCPCCGHKIIEVEEKNGSKNNRR